MKKIAIALFLFLAVVQIGTTIAGGSKASNAVAAMNAKHVAMMEQAAQ